MHLLSIATRQRQNQTQVFPGGSTTVPCLDIKRWRVRFKKDWEEIFLPVLLYKGYYYNISV